ncbi:hypothetical protein [Blautia obeum]|uniref:hypothetical protein n=1 Tax=Blautia obeum TaxID=40520 RepID=UPI00156D6073|nr:hypothetical protein [Blautia obeum]NSG06867.1 hypothetical protein [Blautia obeum]NSG28265.1 hypothetical protein [Blautia obeum]
MVSIKLKIDFFKDDLKLLTVNGQFFPEQMSSRLFMPKEDVANKYQIAFHERFHYLQYIFTPYGHMKWGANRTYSSEILGMWLENNLVTKKKIPVSEYLENNENSIRVLCSIMMQDFAKRLSDVTDGIALTKEELKLLGIDNKNDLLPQIKVNGKKYLLNGLDIIESFAKYEEAILAFLVESKDINDTINPDFLSPRYYVVLYYFVEQLGMDRLEEFPIACELSLCFSHLPRANDRASMVNYHPGWRFIKIVEFLKDNRPEYNIFEDESFWQYTSQVLKECQFEGWDELWKLAEEYAKQCDLSISQEMSRAIHYKKKHPWCLTYPMANPKEFTGEEFNRFYPLFTITDNEVFYNVAGVNQNEIFLENEIQSVVNQIIGYKSKYNLYPNSIQCADSYYGIKSCKHWIDGSCDGHLCAESEVPKLVMDDNSNIIDGCMLEICLNIWGTSIREIEIGNTGNRIEFSKLASKVKEVKERRENP